MNLRRCIIELPRSTSGARLCLLAEIHSAAKDQLWPFCLSKKTATLHHRPMVARVRSRAATALSSREYQLHMLIAESRPSVRGRSSRPDRSCSCPLGSKAALRGRARMSPKAWPAIIRRSSVSEADAPGAAIPTKSITVRQRHQTGMNSQLIRSAHRHWRSATPAR
jgi:hypothetical protein